MLGFVPIAWRSRSVPQGYVYVPQPNLPYNDFSGLTEQYWIHILVISRLPT